MPEFRKPKEFCKSCGKFVNVFYTYSDIDAVNKTKTVHVRCVDCLSKIRDVSGVTYEGDDDDSIL